MTHTFSRVKDTPDYRDHIAAPPAIVLPSSMSLAPWLGPVKDQGQVGSCTAFAGTGLREFLYRKFYSYELSRSVQPNDFVLSPLWLYQMEREIEGTFGSDSGAQSRTIFKAMSKWGCLLEADDPYIEGNAETMLDMDPTSFSKAALYSKIAYHRVLDVPTLKSVIASGYATVIGIPVYDSFENDTVASTGKVPVPLNSEVSIGGHEMLVHGYSDLTQTFMVRNSYGSSWGEGGNCIIPYNYFESPVVTRDGGWDCWTAHIGRPWKS